MAAKPETNFRKRVQAFFKPAEICGEIKIFFTQEMSQVGVPDALLSYYGEFMGLELKSEEGKLSPLQIFNLKAISQSGGLAVGLWPSGFEKFKYDFMERKIPWTKGSVCLYRDNVLTMFSGREG